MPGPRPWTTRMGLTRAFAPEALSPLGNWSLWADLRPHPRPLPRAPYSPHFLLCHSGLSCSCQIGRFTGRGSFLGAETHSPEGEDPVLRRATHQPGAVLGFLQGQRSILMTAGAGWARRWSWLQGTSRGCLLRVAPPWVIGAGRAQPRACPGTYSSSGRYFADQAHWDRSGWLCLRSRMVGGQPLRNSVRVPGGFLEPRLFQQVCRE